MHLSTPLLTYAQSSVFNCFLHLCLTCEVLFPWSTLCDVQVACTGTEDRLLDCDNPTKFSSFFYTGTSFPSASYDPSTLNYFLAEPVEPPPRPSVGVPGSPCAEETMTDFRRLAVICRKFEITGTMPAPLKQPLLRLSKGSVIHGYITISLILHHCDFDPLCARFMTNESAFMYTIRLADH